MTILSIGTACVLIATVAGVSLSAADQAPLIPRETLFSAPSRTAAQLSPDGTMMSYLGSGSGGVLNIFVRTIGKNDDRQVTSDERRGIFSYKWAPDSKHLLYIQDRDGDENWHLHAAHVESGETRDLTPFPGVRADNIIVKSQHPEAVLVALNRRDPRQLDMHRVDLATGEVTLEAENPGDVVEWLADNDLVIRAQAAIDAKAASIIRIRDSAEAPWRVLRTWSFDEAPFDRFQRLVAFSGDGSELLLQTAQGSNTTRIIAVNLKSGAEREVVPADPKYDLHNVLAFALAYQPIAMLKHPETDAIQAYAVSAMKPRWKVLDRALAKDFERLTARFGEGNYDIVDRASDQQRWLIQYVSDTHAGSHHVYDRKTGEFELLFEDRPEFKPFTFAETQVVSYKARDGLEIQAYLTLPIGVEPKGLPLIVNPHGGPWARDGWGFDPGVQWLANRGYAVIQPQFRGSTGFGKRFLNASRGEIGPGAMLQDLSDAVHWAIAEGIADPKRVGIFGGSYGGYVTLCALTFTPELYACGVDMVGPSNMRTLVQSFPPYWAPRLQRWINYIGNVLEDDALNERISPLFHVDAIRAPLLIAHGTNDPRVKQVESDRIVEAMRARNLDVTYIVYPDEGHGLARPPNASDFSGRTEEFLAKHLGGRKEPWKKMEGMTAELR